MILVGITAKNKVGGNESFFPTARLLGVGGSKFPCNNFVDEFFLAPPSSFDLHCLTLRIFFHFGYQIVKLNSKHNSGWPQRNKKQN